MAGQYGPTSVTGSLEDSPGGSARNFHGFLRSGISVGHEAETVETTAFGDAFREHTPTGIKKHDDIELSDLIWDTTATTGTHVVFGTVDDGPQDDGRELVLVFGDSKTYTVDVRLVKYMVNATLDGIQTATAVLRPTGAGVWS